MPPGGAPAGRIADHRLQPLNRLARLCAVPLDVVVGLVENTLSSKSRVPGAQLFITTRNVSLCLEAQQPRAPMIARLSSYIHGSPPIISARFVPLQSGRPPTTPLDSPRREESTAVIGEPPRCDLTKLPRIEHSMQGGDLIGYKL